MSIGKTVLLVLFTLLHYQPQSRGNILETEGVTSQTPEIFLSTTADDVNDDFEEPELQDVGDSYDSQKSSSSLRRRSVGDYLSRRSALDKNFMRFGRSGFFPDSTKPDPKNRNMVRLTRAGGKDGNIIRFGRGSKENFMRFGRGPNSNFMRFGRNDRNFMRFGRDEVDVPIEENFETDEYNRLTKPDRNFLRFGKRGKANNFMRFGKSQGSGFIRFGKSLGKQNSFIRFGRSENDVPNPDYGDENRPFERVERGINDDKSGISLWEIEDENKYDNFLRHSRQFAPKNNRIRFGRDILEIKKSENGNTEQREKRSVNDSSSKDEIWNGSDIKRSLHPLMSNANYLSSLNNLQDIPTSLKVYSPLASGYPNFVIGPEFSVLPHARENKRGKGDSGSNFIRFG